MLPINSYLTNNLGVGQPRPQGFLPFFICGTTGKARSPGNKVGVLVGVRVE